MSRTKDLENGLDELRWDESLKIIKSYSCTLDSINNLEGLYNSLKKGRINFNKLTGALNEN